MLKDRMGWNKKAPRGNMPMDADDTWKLCLSSGRAWILYGLSISQSKGSRKGLSYYWQADGGFSPMTRKSACVILLASKLLLSGRSLRPEKEEF